MIKEKVMLLSETESLQCMINRLPDDHAYKQFFEVELYRSKAGEMGEARMKKKFKEFYLEEEHQILWDVSLGIGLWKVQMDGLLLTERCAVVIESKNISGKIHFVEATGEFYRVDEDDRKTIMEDPAVQLDKHIRFLEAWFKLKNISLPVDGLVVFTPKQCEFMSKPKDKHICKTYQMVDVLHTILQKNPQSNTSHKLMKIKKMIENNQVPYQRLALCEQYRLNWRDLKTGIFCTACQQFTVVPMGKSGWRCVLCKKKEKSASLQVIREYFTLISHALSNQQLREFCRIDSPYTTSRELARYDLDILGTFRNRTYRIKS